MVCVHYSCLNIDIGSFCFLILKKYGEDSEDEGDEDVEEKITRNWSVLKSTPQLRKSKVLHLKLFRSSCCIKAYCVDMLVKIMFMFVLSFSSSCSS